MQTEQLDGRMLGYEGTVHEMLALAAEHEQERARSIYRAGPPEEKHQARRKARNKNARQSRRRNRK